MIYLTAGHSLTDPGAVSKNRVEALEAISLRDAIISKALETNTIIYADNDSHSLWQVQADLMKKVKNNDLVLDIHFNVFNGSVRGTELYHKTEAKQSEIQLGKMIYDATVKSLGYTESRGIKKANQSQHKRLWFEALKCKAFLLEVEFIDHSDAMIDYNDNKQALINNLASFFKRYEMVTSAVV